MRELEVDHLTITGSREVFSFSKFAAGASCHI
jgi:hypothetical protein